MDEAVLGMDIGTSSIKCVMFDLEGTEVFSSSNSYDLLRTNPDCIEIDPEVLWQSVAGAIHKITRQNSENKKKYRISAVGICAMMVMPVLMDKDNNVIRPIIHWFDSRLQKQYFKLKKEGKDKIVSFYSGSAVTGESTVNALDLIKENEPDNYKKINKFFMIKDFIRFKLTGKIYSDYGDASGTQLLDTKKWEWSSQSIAELGFKRDMFPDLLKPADKGGFVTKEAARLTGLDENTPVAIGSGDGITTIFGLGTYADGQTGITVGSAGIVATASKLFPEDIKQRSYVFCHPFCDRWYSLMATASSGEIFRWYNNSIIKNDRVSYADLDKEASECPAGAEGLIFLPYLLGSRNPYSNPNACGMMLGLRYKHDRKHLTRAILEGICFELKDILRVQEEILSKKTIKIKEAGLSGGICQSSFWTQLLADILQTDFVTSKTKELGALGASIMAAASSGLYKNLEEALNHMVREDKKIIHNKELEDIYSRKFDLFHEMYKVFENKFDLFNT
ncbi:MAG: FGGY family carbohydrate kinase [Actinomycetota bacterium]